jgi:putative transposase
VKRIPPSTRIAAQIPGGERLSARHLKKGERGIWPRRFWEHAICDEGDYERQVDYLHYNPVKHGHVTRVADWPYSSFQRYVQSGIYNLEGPADDNVRSIELG